MQRYSMMLLCMMAACAPADDQEAVETDAPAATASAPDINTQIRDLVKKHQEAFAAANVAVLDSIIGANVLYVQAGGGEITGHDKRLAEHSSGELRLQGPPAFEVLDVKSFGDDFAVARVRGTSRGGDHGREWNGSATLLMGFARTGSGPWEMVYHQGIIESK